MKRKQRDGQEAVQSWNKLTTESQLEVFNFFLCNLQLNIICISSVYHNILFKVFNCFWSHL